MSRKLFLVLCVLTYGVSSPVVGADMQNEIDHLLVFVATTECQYERNGTLYSGKDAAKHIKNKYNYFKDKIDSAERFIELSATKSTMSGKYYAIVCKDKPEIKSQEWLLQELNNYRNNNTRASAKQPTQER